MTADDWPSAQATLSSRRVDVSFSDSYPAAWRRLGDVPLLATAPWAAAVGQRIEGAPFWASATSQDRVLAGFAGITVHDPNAYVYGNCRLLLLSDTSPFLSGLDRERRIAFLCQGVPDDQLFPNVVVTFPGYSSFAVGEESNRDEVLREIISALVARARDQGARLVGFPYVDGRRQSLRRVLRDLGFQCIPLTHTTELPVPPGGFEEYLARLGKDWRDEIRRERRRLTESGLSSRAHLLDEGLLQQMSVLRCAERRKHNRPADQPAEYDRLAAVVAHLRGLITVIGVEDSMGRLASFTLFVRDRDAWFPLFTGTDGDGRARYAYFETMFYRAIEVATDRGIREIWYGWADQAKRLRGCRLCPVEAWVASWRIEVNHLLTEVAAVWREGWHTQATSSLKNSL